MVTYSHMLTFEPGTYKYEYCLKYSSAMCLYFVNMGTYYFIEATEFQLCRKLGSAKQQTFHGCVGWFADRCEQERG